ncbi:type VI secretion system protein TssA [Salmonella enterica subsp. enterica serovar Kimberley]|nr:type VI secretion system protein TssA [Salmonella enterica subsp. enterica serovar Kimberley]
MEHLIALLAPICTDSPCGESIRYSPEFDRLVAARKQDDETLPSGVWQSTPRRADWKEVARIASELTIHTSKDLVIMCWLGEAWIRLRGLLALPDALAFPVLALERYPADLHPQIKGDDYDYRAAPLGWLAQHFAELVTDAPLFISGEESVSLSEWQQGKLVGLTSAQAQTSIAGALVSGLQWLERLSAVCRPWPEDSAPSFSGLEQKIKTCQQALDSTLPEQSPPAAQLTIPVSAPIATFSSREEAYQILKLVADYLQRTEPHSPVSYLLHRAFTWGHMPLPELLNELICSDEAARQLWRQLGVLP